MLDYQSPSWTRSTLYNDEVIGWSKAKVCVYADSVLCLRKVEQDPGAGYANWTRQIEDLERYPTRSSVCLCSMKMRIASRMPSKSRITRTGFYQDIGLFWVQFRKRDGTKAYSQQNGTALERIWSYYCHSHQCFESRNVEHEGEAKVTSHFNGDVMITELLFQTVHSVNQVSIFAAVTKWCYKFAWKKEEKHTFPHTADNRIVAVVETEEGDMLISSPNLAQGNLMMQSEAKLRALEKKVHMTQLCEQVLFQCLVTAGIFYQVRPDGEDGWRNITPPCREFSCSRVFSQAKPLEAIPAGTIIGPIQEVQIVKILDEYVVGLAILSICKPGDVTYVVISRETERFVNEIHTHEARIRSSCELLENSQESKESPLAPRKLG